MSWKGSWGSDQSQSKWGNNDSWSKGGGNSWGSSSKGDSKGASKNAPKGDSKSDSKGDSKGAKGGITIKPPAKQAAVDSNWNQEPAWKKQATGDSSHSSGKGGDTWQSKGKGGDNWQSASKGGKENAPKGAKGGSGQQAQAPQKKIEDDKAKKAFELKTMSDKATREVEMADKLATQTMEKAKKVLEDEKATLPAMRVSVDGLQKQADKMKGISDSIQKDCEEAKKAGPAGKDCVQELQKAMVKANGVKNQVAIILGKLKPKAEKQQKEQEAKAKAAKEEADRKAKEAKDTASFKPILAKITKEVAVVEEAVNTVAKKADAIVAKTPEGEELDKATADIEKEASEALKKLNTTRTELNEKFKGVVAFAPEAKKVSHTSLSDLQKKLVDCGKKASVYTSFKKELPKLIASKEALAEVKEKLETQEKAVTNVTKLGDMPKLDKARIEAIDSQVEPAKKAINEAATLIAQKMRIADAVSSSKFMDFKKKGDEMLKKIQAVMTKIKKSRDAIMSDDYIILAGEKLETAEAGWKACQDAEMPFLTGVEVLEGEENDRALKECAEAIATSTAAINDGKSFVQKKLADCKQSEKEVLDKMTAALTPILTKLTAVEANVTKFKKEHSERKILSVMSAAIDAVEAVEKVAGDVEKQGKTLGDVEDDSAESITEVADKIKTALAEANTKFADANKLVKEKILEAKAGAGNDKVSKVNSRMTAAQEKLNKVKTAIQSAEKVVRAKKAIGAGEEKVKEAEGEVAKVEKIAGEKFTVESVKAFTDSCNSAQLVIRNAGTVIQPHLAAAPAKAKEELQALMERKNEAQKTIDKLKTDTKEAREEVLCDFYLSESEKWTKAAEDAAEKMEGAEKPFLLGDLPLADGLKTIKTCEETAAEVKKALTEASKHIELKSKETKAFGKAASEKAMAGFKGMTERVKAVSAKSVSFEKELKERTKSIRMTEAGAKVDETEAALKSTVAAAEPFTKEGAADMSEKDAETPLKLFQDAEKELGKLVATTKNHLQSRLQEQKANKENTETLKKLQERVAKVQTELATVKKSTTSHEQRALGTQMLADATEKVSGLATEVKKACDACAPLLEKSGEDFLVDTSLRTLIAALSAHMKEKELDADALFKEVGKGKAIKEKAFVEYLTKLPEAISHDELSAFDAERRAAIFKAVSKNGSSLTAADFTGMFAQTYSCVKPVTLTDRFATDGSETVCKVEMHAEVVLTGVPKEDETGLLRAEAKVGDKEGWVTISQKKGGQFLKLKTKLESFYQTMDKAVSDASAVVSRVLTLVNNTSKPAGNDEASMKTARAEIAKLKEKVLEAQKGMEELKKKVATAKREYSVKEKAEMNAHIEARNQREAAAFLEAPNAKLEALVAAAKAAEDASAAFTSLSGDELLAFETPAAVLEAAEKALVDVNEKANETKEICKEQFKAASDVTPQTGGTAEAKKQIKIVQTKIEEAIRKASKCVTASKSNCQKIVANKLEPTAAAIRAYASKNKLSGEALFDKFKEEDKITEAGFAKLVKSLGDSAITLDVAKLIGQKLGKDGISKDAFLNYVVVYYKVTRSIAFTDILDISQCKTLRKIETGEVLEMLEEPVKHEGSSTTRLRAKALAEPIVEGWVTLCGNQGSSFLEKTKKP